MFLLRDGLGDARDARQIRTFGCVAVSLTRPRLRGDMTPPWTPAEQAAPIRSAHERTLVPEEVAGRSDE
jgi:hypothetical protein